MSGLVSLATVDAVAVDTPEGPIAVGQNPRILVYPDPESPRDSCNWRFQLPARLTESKYNPATRILSLRVSTDLDEDAERNAKQALAHRAKGAGQRNAKVEDTHLDAMVPESFQLKLQTGKREVILKSGGRGPLSSFSAEYRVREDEQTLHDHLTLAPGRPDLTLVVGYRMSQAISADISARAIASEQGKTLERVLRPEGAQAARKSGAILVARDSLQELTASMRQSFCVDLRMPGGPAGEKLLEKLKDQIGDRVAKLRPADVDSLKGGTYFVYNTAAGQFEMAAETVELITRELDREIEKIRQMEDVIDTISDKANHDLSDEQWYNTLKIQAETSGKASVDIVKLLGVSGSFDLKGAFEKLDSGQRKAVHDSKEYAKSLHSQKQNLIDREKERFRGENTRRSILPKDLRFCQIRTSDLEQINEVRGRIVELLQSSTFEYENLLEVDGSDSLQTAELKQIKEQLRLLQASHKERSAEVDKLQEEVIGLRSDILSGQKSAMKAIDLSRVRYGTTNKVFSTITPDASLVFVPRNTERDWVPENLTFGKRVLAVWATPYDNVPGITGIYMFNVRPEGNTFRVNVAMRDNIIRMTFHVLYYED